MTAALRLHVLARLTACRANPTARVQRGKGSPSHPGRSAGRGRVSDGGRKANQGREAH